MNIKKLFFLIFFISTFATSQPYTGKQYAQDVMALVSYLELSNIGSRDSEC